MQGGSIWAYGSSACALRVEHAGPCVLTQALPVDWQAVPSPRRTFPRARRMGIGFLGVRLDRSEAEGRATECGECR